MSSLTILLRCPRPSKHWNLGKSMATFNNINPDKSLVMHVGSKLPARYNYSVCSKIIKPSVLIRDLGVTYDCNLRFDDYIDGIVKKAFMRTNLLSRAFVSGNVLILTRAYLTYISWVLYIYLVASPSLSNWQNWTYTEVLLHQESSLSYQTFLHGTIVIT